MEKSSSCYWSCKGQGGTQVFYKNGHSGKKFRAKIDSQLLLECLYSGEDKLWIEHEGAKNSYKKMPCSEALYFKQGNEETFKITDVYEKQETY